MPKQEFTLNNEPERQRLVEYARAVPLDKGLRVTIETVRSKRTLSQNSLMWKWINEAADALAKDTGHTPDEIHQFFKQKFLPGNVVVINGRSANYYTTTKLSIDEMSDYLTRIQAFVVGEMGIYLTIPPQRGMTDASGAEVMA